MRSYKYSDQTQNEALKTKVKMEEKKAPASRDVSIVPDITFWFVEDFIRKGSQSLGDKELSKGYKYFWSW